MFTVYQASAGSGKTTRLVAEYLTLCFTNIYKFKNILAITFTNNATAEMKSRILGTLYRFAFVESEQWNTSERKIFSFIVEKCVNEENELQQNLFIKKQSQKLLNEILYDYDNFSISTIDSFFQRILRAFAIELGLKVNFNLEIKLDDFYQQVIDSLLNKISKENKQLSERVLSIVETKMIDSGKWKIEQELRSILKVLNDEQAFHPLKALNCTDFSQFEAAKKYFQNKRDRLLNIIDNQIDEKEKENLLMETSFFSRNVDKLSLLFDIQMIINDIRSRDNIFHLAETNAKIYDNIKDDDTPYIYEKLGTKYSYFFIDEFQDTSKLQWENLLPLIKNALSGKNQFNESGNAYLFGDQKQAIYRFRNGDSSLLQELSSLEGFQKQVFSYAKEDNDYSLCPDLNTNFRSGKNIIRFNNEFFSFLSQHPDFEYAAPYYQHLVQTIPTIAGEGSVSIQFKDLEDKTATDEYLQSAVLRSIEQVISEGYTYQDVAILTGSNSRASSLGRTLAENHIPVISSDSLLLTSSQEVRLLIATLQYIFNPEDNLAKMDIIHILNKRSTSTITDTFSGIKKDADFVKLLSSFGIVLHKKRLQKYQLLTLIKEIISLYQLYVADPFIISLLECINDFMATNIGDLSHFLHWWKENESTQSLTPSEGINAVRITTIHKAKGLQYPVVIFPFTRYSYEKTKSEYWIPDEKKESPLPYYWVTLTGSNIPDSYKWLSEQESGKSRLDQLNKIYVAHTRAIQKLMIITEKPKDGNYAKYLKKFLDTKTENLANANCYIYNNGQWVTEENIISSNFPYSSKAATANTVILKQIPTSNFTFDTSQLAFEKTCEPSLQQQKGDYLHYLLSSLTDFPQNEEEIDALLLTVEKQYCIAVKQMLLKIITDPALKNYFKKGVKRLNEITIISKTGELYRPDRIVFLDNEVVVIDYKTGEYSEHDQMQIDRYCELLGEMGYKQVKGFIVRGEEIFPSTCLGVESVFIDNEYTVSSDIVSVPYLCGE